MVDKMNPRIGNRVTNHLSEAYVCVDRWRRSRMLSIRLDSEKWRIGNVLLFCLLAIGAAGADGSILGGNLRVCTLQQCFGNEEGKKKHECASGCYFEEGPVDASPEAICNVMAKDDHEGNYSYMYRDTVGKVTIGIGNMLPNADAAINLPFIIEENGVARDATEPEIRDAFNGLPRQPADCDGNTAKGRAKCKAANKYELSNKLRISSQTINTLCQGRLKSEFIPTLETYFPSFYTYPSRVRAATLDIIYNVGPAGFSEIKWPGFHRAAKARNWQEAANESKRGDVQPTRNAYVKDLLEVAGKQEILAKQRLSQCPPGGIF